MLNRGSEWRRWEPHIHSPGTILNLAPRLGKNLVVGNALEVVSLLEGHNILAVFQGHLHLNEVDRFKEIPFVTCGAVSGNWRHGTHEGTPEGFTVVTLRNGEISWRYETYGFKSVDARSAGTKSRQVEERRSTSDVFG